MSRADSEARELIDEHGLTELPVDLDKVARSLGAIVVRQPINNELSGMLMRRNGTIVIGLNSHLGPARQRFVLAHLIGHLHLHRSRDLILDTVDRHRLGNLASMPTDREEAEANRFASGLLVSEPVVRRMAAEADFDTSDQLVDLLTPRFGVTRTVMAYRLLSLGIITAA